MAPATLPSTGLCDQLEWHRLCSFAPQLSSTSVFGQRSGTLYKANETYIQVGSSSNIKIALQLTPRSEKGAKSNKANIGEIVTVVTSLHCAGLMRQVLFAMPKTS